jgi:hypothetical protein
MSCECNMGNLYCLISGLEQSQQCPRRSQSCSLRNHRRYNWKFDGWKLEGVQWAAMPRQIPSLIALFMVVTFGSALDVAAIQQDTPFPLDFNQELITVGEHCAVPLLLPQRHPHC